jgi:hypothetical protein
MERPLIFLEFHGPRANEKILVSLESVRSVHEIKEGGRYTPVLEEEKAAKCVIFTQGQTIPVKESYRQVLNQMHKLGRR